MATRLQGDFYDIDGTLYTVILDDADFVGSADDFNLSELKISHESVTDIHEPIIPSKCKLTFRVESSIATVFTDMVGAEEERFRIRVDRAGSLFWAGMILNDQITLQDKPYPFQFSLTAVDGLTRLKKKDYTGVGAEWSGEQTFLQHLYNCLGLINTADFWGASDVYLKSYHRLRDSQQAYIETASILPNVRVQHKAFSRTQDNGEIEYKDGWFVLTQIARALESRIYFSDGAFHFEEIACYALTSETTTIKQWDKTAGALTNDALSNWGARLLNVGFDIADELVVLSGSINRFLSALNRVEVSYNHFANTNLFSQLTTAVTWTQSANDAIEVGEVEDNAQQARLFFSAPIYYSITFDTISSLQIGYLKRRCQIKIDDGTNPAQYVSRTVDYDFGNYVYGNAEWTTTPAYIEFYTTGIQLDGAEYYDRFEFVTPVLSSNLSGTVSVDFDFVELQGIGAVIPDSGATSYTETWTIEAPRLDILFEGTLESQYDAELYTATNDNSANSDVYELNIYVGGGPSIGSFGAIDVYDGSSWQQSGNWYFGNTDLENLPHSARIAKQILTPRLKPAEIIEGTIYGGGMAHHLLERATKRYIYMGGTFDCWKNRTDGAWCFITLESTLATTISIPVETEPRGTEFDNNVLPGRGLPFEPVPSWEGTTIEPVVTGLTMGTAPFYTTGLIASTGPSTTLTLLQPFTDIQAFQDGDNLQLIHPGTGERTIVTVNQDESDKTIAVDSFTPAVDYPPGTIVAPAPGATWMLLNQARRHTIPVYLFPAHIEIYAATTPATLGYFFRVPDHMNGWKFAAYTADIYSAGGGVGSFDLRVSVGGTNYDQNILWSDTQVKKTAATYQTLSTGDLIEFSINSYSLTSGSGSLGLTVTLQLIAIA